jgi:hypothetical protein
MQNGLPTTFLIGQHLKAESLTPQVSENWSEIRPLVPKLSTTAMQNEDQPIIVQEAFKIRSVAYDPLVVPRRFTISSSSALKTKQSWEGVVINCGTNKFVARITDRTNPSNPEEIAEFESEEVSDDDQHLIRPGASFYWTVGTEKSSAGQIRNVAIVNFRRTPRWSRASIQNAANRAKEIVAILGQE